MTNYEKAKATAREKAVDFSNTCGEMNLSYADLAEIGNKFRTLGKRYGLLREFRENGILC